MHLLFLLSFFFRDELSRYKEGKGETERIFIERILTRIVKIKL